MPYICVLNNNNNFPEGLNEPDVVGMPLLSAEDRLMQVLADQNRQGGAAAATGKEQKIIFFSGSVF